MSTTRVVAFCIGLFSLTVGIRSYDSEIATAPVPVVTGALVMVLAVLGLIPEFKRCLSCNRKIPKKAAQCRHCGATQPSQN